MTGGAAQSELQCSACAGQRAYDPAQQALVCQSCGTRTDLHSPADQEAQTEHPYTATAPAPDPLVTEAAPVHHCETCGGDVVFVGPTLSTRCAYCDGPVVLRQTDDGYATQALIPFTVREADAQRAAQDWVRRRLAAPSDLAQIVGRARVAGLYVPFWTFDSREVVAYWAVYSERHGKRTRIRTVSGEMRMQFDDVLVPASPHVTPLIRDGILHAFDPRRLRAYGPGYLAGFGAERHHQTVRDGLAANADDKDLLIRNRIKRHLGRRSAKVTRYVTDTSDIHYRRILLPVWILHYTYRDAPMKVVVCGFQARAFGERPFSTAKLLGYAGVLSALAIGLGLAWGALQLP